MKKLPTTAKDMIVSEEDLNVCFNKSDLKNCPFCNARANSYGKKNKGTLIIGYTVICSNTKCMASIHYNSLNQQEARNGAVERWNRRF